MDPLYCSEACRAFCRSPQAHPCADPVSFSLEWAGVALKEQGSPLLQQFWEHALPEGAGASWMLSMEKGCSQSWREPCGCRGLRGSVRLIPKTGSSAPGFKNKSLQNNQRAFCRGFLSQAKDGQSDVGLGEGKWWQWPPCSAALAGGRGALLRGARQSSPLLLFIPDKEEEERVVGV